MPFQVTLQPSQHHFQADSEETLLQAGLRQSVGLPYGCRNGACGACKAKIVSGEIDHGQAQEHALSAAERAAGVALLCCASARSDVVIECREVGGGGDIPVKTLPCRVQKMERLAPDVIALHLKLPASERLLFRAGQYIDILLKDGKRRSYSIANAPHDDEFIQLHVRLVPGGLFTEQVFGSMKERDILRFNGPHGSFFLREDSAKPIILLAGGTGFAPVKAIVEHAIEVGSTRPMHLYWGARTQQDLYLDALPREWSRQHRHIHYVPVLSEPSPQDAWQGRTGFVHRAVMADFADLSAHQVYACGTPAMIDAARAEFTAQCSLPAGEFFADAFSFANDGA
jgi:CDP-4-dehydro-6-deoxyglucose reductase, E3